MKLKSYYATQAEVPEALRSYYVEQDGKFVLDVEGMVPKARLDEFRENNTTLMQERDDAKAALAKYGDLTPEKAKEAVKKAKDLDQAIADKKLLDEKGIDAVVSERMQRATEAHREEVQTLTVKISTLEGESSKRQAAIDQRDIHSAFRDAAADPKIGVNPMAMPDVLARVDRDWKVVDGKTVRMGSDGKVVRGEDGVTAQTPKEYLKELAKNAPYLFGQNAGGGARGGDGGAGDGDVNPWKKETFNLTQQGKIFKADPEKAARLKAAAGTK